MATSWWSWRWWRWHTLLTASRGGKGRKHLLCLLHDVVTKIQFQLLLQKVPLHPDDGLFNPIPVAFHQTTTAFCELVRHIPKPFHIPGGPQHLVCHDTKDAEDKSVLRESFQLICRIHDSHQPVDVPKVPQQTPEENLRVAHRSHAMTPRICLQELIEAVFHVHGTTAFLIIPISQQMHPKEPIVSARRWRSRPGSSLRFPSSLMSTTTPG